MKDLRLRSQIVIETANVLICIARQYIVIMSVPNLVPRAFLRRGEEGREKTLASADHVTNLNITFAPNLC